MKRILASLVLVLFSIPLLIAEVPPAPASSIDPFADVEGIALTEVEEEAVEGEGLIGAISGAFGGAIGGAISESVRTTVRMVKKTETRTGPQIASDIKSSAKYGAITMGIWGAIVGP